MHIWNPIRKYLGWRNWAVLEYNAAFENVFVIFYIALRQQHYGNEFVASMIVFLVFSTFATTFGYLVNDYADIELDRRHGKSNTFEDDSRLKALAVVGTVLLLTLICAVPFLSQPAFVVLLIAWIIISAFYSLPPLRLKERGPVGLIFVVLAQRLLPVLIIFAAFHFSHYWELAVIGLYVLFRGVSSDVNHQLQDWQRDRATGTKTFAVHSGIQRVQRLFRFSLEAEKILLLLILVWFVYILHERGLWLLIVLSILVLMYIAAYGYAIVSVLWSEREVVVNPFTSERNIFQFLHHSFPSVILAGGLNVILIPFNYLFSVILITFILIRKIYSIDMVKQSFVYRIGKTFIEGLKQ